jgi:hypothetical protein
MSPIKAPKLTAQGSVDLPEEVFGERFHEAVVWEAARAEQLARRRGTAATLTRGRRGPAAPESDRTALPTGPAVASCSAPPPAPTPSR